VSLLSRFEQACAAFIERAFARSFPSDLAPAHVARKLVAVMEAHVRQDGARLVAPASYEVSVHPMDFERLGSERAYLEREWAELLRDLATRVGAVFSGGEPNVRMTPLEGVPLGAAQVAVVSRPFYRLRMVKGLPADGVYRLEAGVSVGRGEDANVALTDPSVSRRHASIAIVDGVPVVRDLGSRNGTFVNGERVTTRALRVGDVLTFGNTEMRIESGG
jgi:hypothetical protein